MHLIEKLLINLIRHKIRDSSATFSTKRISKRSSSWRLPWLIIVFRALHSSPLYLPVELFNQETFSWNPSAPIEYFKQV